MCLGSRPLELIRDVDPHLGHRLDGGRVLGVAEPPRGESFDPRQNSSSSCRLRKD